MDSTRAECCTASRQRQQENLPSLQTLTHAIDGASPAGSDILRVIVTGIAKFLSLAGGVCRP